MHVQSKFYIKVNEKLLESYKRGEFMNIFFQLVIGVSLGCILSYKDIMKILKDNKSRKED